MAHRLCCCFYCFPRSFSVLFSIFLSQLRPLHQVRASNLELLSTLNKITLTRRRKKKLSCLHIALRGINIVEERFNRHPLDGKFSCTLGLLVFTTLVNISGQAKVRYLDKIIITDKNITRCEIAVNELLL